MQEKHQIQDLMGVTMEKIRDMVDVQTIIGDPIVVSDTVTIIPVSKVSYGFASGGSDLPAKSTPKDLFGGGVLLRGDGGEQPRLGRGLNLRAGHHDHRHHRRQHALKISCFLQNLL